ncbi:MAG TPA: cysteine hydrolase family protein [Methylophilaceae bacterium]|nr:cysteine hydrolase family protein [Methylophilaceae bacterium]
MTNCTTLRDISGLGQTPASLKDSALILVDCQNTYRRGVMRLTGVEEALVEAQRLLEMARDLHVPIFHIQHDAGAGSPYDISTDIGAISSEVAPRTGEPVITKNYPNSFVHTDLDAQLKALGVQNVVLAGFMTHMCIRSTAEGAFNFGYAPAVVANAAASRPLAGVSGEIVPAQIVHQAALANIRDLFGVVVESPEQLG